MKKYNVFLSFGSNIGNSIEIIKKSYLLISKDEKIDLIKTSNFFKTKPISEIDQRYFINSAVLIKTSYSPIELFKKLEQIEIILGKKNKPKNMPRIIDIDIIFFGNKMINKDGLIIPHMQWKKRLFVLIPLLDLTTKITLPNNKELNLSNFIDKNFPSSIYNNKTIIEAL
jgi:2-amino-4-hydroxy-6-hydroxymethyldihydropteridine diphosphokinase